jgi:hypothetical protein
LELVFCWPTVRGTGFLRDSPSKKILDTNGLR